MDTEFCWVKLSVIVVLVLLLSTMLTVVLAQQNVKRRYIQDCVGHNPDIVDFEECQDMYRVSVLKEKYNV